MDPESAPKSGELPSFHDRCGAHICAHSARCVCLGKRENATIGSWRTERDSNPR
jgi:hypothetical protein